MRNCRVHGAGDVIGDTRVLLIHVDQDSAGVKSGRGRTTDKRRQAFSPAVARRAGRGQFPHRAIKFERMLRFVAVDCDIEVRREYPATGLVNKANNDQGCHTVTGIRQRRAVDASSLHFLARCTQLIPGFRRLLDVRFFHEVGA